ncbi:MAG: hypothetical protein K8F91_22365 [Candidatus Obscuribacterales bacterium]|nr:hypothetical protein [Candidatus Obscuribacterales bacterium]
MAYQCNVCNDTGGYYNGRGTWQRCTSCCGHPHGRKSSAPIGDAYCNSCRNVVDVTSSGKLASHGWHGDGPCPGSWSNPS